MSFLVKAVNDAMPVFEVRVLNDARRSVIVTTRAHKLTNLKTAQSFEKGSNGVSYSSELALFRKVDTSEAFTRVDSGEEMIFRLGESYGTISIFLEQGPGETKLLMENHPINDSTLVFCRDDGATVVPLVDQGSLAKMKKYRNGTLVDKYPVFENNYLTLVVENRSDQQMMTCVDFDEYRIVNLNRKIKIEKLGEYEDHISTEYEKGFDSTGYSLIAPRKFTMYCVPLFGQTCSRDFYFSVSYKEDDEWKAKAKHHRISIQCEQTFHRFRPWAKLVLKNRGTWTIEENYEMEDEEFQNQRPPLEGCSIC